MSIDPHELRALPTAEKLRLVEVLWDEIGAASAPLPLPKWLDEEAAARRDEMLNNPALGVDHDEVWRRIDRRNG